MSEKRVIREPVYFPKANVDTTKYLFIISKMCGPFAFMTITETGLKKSIMDATGGVRFFLKEAMLHDYNEQKQGPENKVIVPAHFILENTIIDTKASLYRPITKKGDPRIWFYDLKNYVSVSDLLLLFSVDKEIYVVNLSNKKLSDSIINKGFVYEQIIKSRIEAINARDKLLRLLNELHEKGWVKATTHGDTAVGDTLEHELGISRNNSTQPDYKGIELKASRINRGGQRRQRTRITLFAKVPDEGMTYREILESYGKVQIPDRQTQPRLQLYDTFKASRANAYNLFLFPNESNERLEILYSKSGDIHDPANRYVSSWKLENLANSLKEKHKETFFVKAKSKLIDGEEYFLYESVVHTSNPNTSVLFALFEEDKITLDLLIHKKEDGSTRDHGALFKMWPQDLPLLFGDEEIIDLN